MYVCMYTSINIVSKCISIWGPEKNMSVDRARWVPIAKNPHRRRAKSETPITLSACRPQKPIGFFHFWNHFFECIYVLAHFCWCRRIWVWYSVYPRPCFISTKWWFCIFVVVGWAKRTIKHRVLKHTCQTYTLRHAPLFKHESCWECMFEQFCQ